MDRIEWVTIVLWDVLFLLRIIPTMGTLVVVLEFTNFIDDSTRNYWFLEDIWPRRIQGLFLLFLLNRLIQKIFTSHNLTPSAKSQSLT